MKKNRCFFQLLILPLISGCSCSKENEKVSFYLGNVDNKIIELNLNELSSKIDTQHDSFLLATHKGNGCFCWTRFQYVLEQYNNQRKTEGKNYLPIYSFDTELMTDNLPDTFKVDIIPSGYVDFYIFKDGEILTKYSGSAKKDLEMFENTDKFSTIVNKFIKEEPINNYAYASYDYVRANLINKEDNEFALITVRSGCGDCNYCMPNVVTPFLKENTPKIPVYVCDIEQYRGTNDYDTVKANLSLTIDSNQLGFGAGVVPTYQYWKNGQLVDAGVYANDSFQLNVETNKVEIKTTYFDGTRDLKYTTENLVTKMNSEESLDVIEYNGKYFMDVKKAAVYHDPLIKSFLTYYCISK